MTGASTQRIDKWLWYARFIKTRTAAARLVADGKVRVNKMRVTKPGYNVAVNDILTFTISHHLRIVRIVAPGSRRGPAVEAQELYEDLTPVPDKSAEGDAKAATSGPAMRPAGSGRPTKKERRDRDAWLDTDE